MTDEDIGKQTPDDDRDEGKEIRDRSETNPNRKSTDRQTGADEFEDGGPPHLIGPRSRPRRDPIAIRMVRIARPI
jgi:hypothetical protein